MTTPLAVPVFSKRYRIFVAQVLSQVCFHCSSLERDWKDCFACGKFQPEILSQRGILFFKFNRDRRNSADLRGLQPLTGKHVVEIFQRVHHDDVKKIWLRDDLLGLVMNLSSRPESLLYSNVPANAPLVHLANERVRQAIAIGTPAQYLEEHVTTLQYAMRMYDGSLV